MAATRAAVVAGRHRTWPPSPQLRRLLVREEPYEPLGVVPQHQSALLVLDCDTLLHPDTDQSMIVYSAAAGTREASALDMLRVTGIEPMTVR